MSLDVYLIDKEDWQKAKDNEDPLWGKEYDSFLYQANITHNLNVMARVVSEEFYQALWHPHKLILGLEDDEYNDEVGPPILAQEIVTYIETGLETLKKDSEKFVRYNASNGWGTYETFVPWLEKYVKALKDNPNSLIMVSI
jgi:hypothetical protein